MPDHEKLCHRTRALFTGSKPIGTDLSWLSRVDNISLMATLRMFASVREAAGGERSITIEGSTVGEVVDAAVDKFGGHFAALLPTCKTWVNGEPADLDTAVSATDEVAILPPVSGG